MKKFKAGDKVVPKSKTVKGYGGLENSGVWHRAKEMNQPYLVVTGYDSPSMGECVVVDTQYNEGILDGDYFNENDLIPYVEKKFQRGDKVVPISKSIWNSLDDSNVWKRTKEKGQPYMYVREYRVPSGSDQECLVVSDRIEHGGDFFLENDLIPYVETFEAQAVDPEETSGWKVGDRIFLAGQVFKIEYDCDLDYHFTMEDGTPVYTCTASAEHLVERFLRDYKNGENYLFTHEQDVKDLQKEQIAELEAKVKHMSMDLDDLNAKLNIEKAMRENAERDCDTYQSIAKELQHEVECLEKKCESLEEEMVLRVGERQGLIQHHEEQRNKMEHTISTQYDTIQGLQGELKRANKIIDKFL